MGLCSSSAECEPAPAQTNRAVAAGLHSLVESSASIAGLQPSPLKRGESAERVARREVLAAAESFAACCSSRSSCSSTDYELWQGAEVALSPGYGRILDAAEGPLREGAVGVVSSIDPGSESGPALYCVTASGRSWWYARGALQITGRTEPDPSQFGHDLRRALESSTKVAAVACARWNQRVSGMHQASRPRPKREAQTGSSWPNVKSVIESGNTNITKPAGSLEPEVPTITDDKQLPSGLDANSLHSVQWVS